MSDHTIKTVYTAQRLNRAYIDICNEFKKNPPKNDWNGVYNFKSK